jgi:hypothetical protein
LAPSAPGLAFTGGTYHRLSAGLFGRRSPLMKRLKTARLHGRPTHVARSRDVWGRILERWLWLRAHGRIEVPAEPVILAGLVSVEDGRAPRARRTA